jgi:hypothetical protein
VRFRGWRVLNPVIMRDRNYAFRPSVLLLVAGMGLAACRHAPTLQPRGESGFTFIDPPASPTPVQKKGVIDDAPTEPVETMLLAVPHQPLAKPIYPPAALGRQSTPALVAVRITVDATGSVADVRPSWLAFSSPGPFAAEFQAAVEAALAQWRFRPAELRRLAPATDPARKGSWILLSEEKTACVFDVAFTFTVEGDVLSRAAK